MQFDFVLTTSWDHFDVQLQRRVASELEKRGYRTCALTPTPDARSEISAHVTQAYDISLLADDEQLSAKAIENRFGISSTRMLCHTEQMYYNISYERALERAKRIAAAVDTLFNRHSFSYSFQHRGGELFRLLTHYRTQKENGLSIWNTFSPFENREAFTAGLHRTWDNYETVPYDHVPEEDRSETRSYIQRFREQQRFYSHNRDGCNIPNPLKKIRQIARRLRERPGSPRTSVKAAGRRALNERVNRSYLPSLESSRQRCRQSDFVFFPLQFPAESRLTASAPQFYEQSWIVEYLSRVVPDGIDVFVKQHPNHIGQQSPIWLRSLARHSNIEFLNPDHNAHEILEQSRATIVINNTVGFESLFYETPLVVLGDGFYSDTPAARAVNDLQELDATIASAVNGETSEKDTLASIYSLKQATYDVPSDESAADWAPKMTTALLSFIHDLPCNSNASG